MVKYIFKRLPYKREKVRLELSRIAAVNGCLDIIKLLIDESDDDFLIELLYHAICYNHLDIIKYLYSINDRLIISDDECHKMFDYIFKKSNLETILYMIDRYEAIRVNNNLPELKIVNNYNIFFNNNLDVIKYFVEKWEIQLDSFHVQIIILRNNLDIYKYIFERFKERFIKLFPLYDFNYKIDIKIVEYLLKIGVKLNAFYCEHSINNGRLDIIQAILKYGKEDLNDITSTIIKYCPADKIEFFFDYIDTQKDLLEKILNNNEFLLARALVRSDLETIKDLIENKRYYIVRRRYNLLRLIKSKEIFIYLIEQNNAKIPISYFEKYCEYLESDENNVFQKDFYNKMILINLNRKNNDFIKYLFENRRYNFYSISILNIIYLKGNIELLRYFNDNDRGFSQKGKVLQPKYIRSYLGCKTFKLNILQYLIEEKKLELDQSESSLILSSAKNINLFKYIFDKFPGEKFYEIIRNRFSDFDIDLFKNIYEIKGNKIDDIIERERYLVSIDIILKKKLLNISSRLNVNLVTDI